MAHTIKPLSALTPAAREKLKITLQYRAYELEKKIAQKTTQLEQMACRTTLLNAANAALNHLRSTAEQILEALQQAGAAPALITEQEAVVSNYARQLSALPPYSKKVPHTTELVLMQVALEEMEHKRTTFLAGVAEIDALENNSE